jgi:hypothetical protein
MSSASNTSPHFNSPHHCMNPGLWKGPGWPSTNQPNQRGLEIRRAFISRLAGLVPGCRREASRTDHQPLVDMLNVCSLYKLTYLSIYLSSYLSIYLPTIAIHIMQYYTQCTGTYTHAVHSVYVFCNVKFGLITTPRRSSYERLPPSNHEQQNQTWNSI